MEHWLNSVNGGEVFVETGTYLGETLAVAATKYQECHSIEFYYPTYLSAIEKFRVTPNVRVYHGTSPEVLPRILQPSKSTVIFLDAHFMREIGDPAQSALDESYGQCPLIEELGAIFSVQWAVKPMIIIDDAHLFSEEFWLAAPQRVEYQGQVADNYVIIDGGTRAVAKAGHRRAAWPSLDEVKAEMPGYDVMTWQNMLVCREVAGRKVEPSRPAGFPIIPLPSR